MTVSVWKVRMAYVHTENESMRGVETQIFTMGSYEDIEDIVKAVREYYKNWIIHFESIERLERLAVCLGESLRLPKEKREVEV